MKLRQKLAMVLASAMIVSAVPVVTMAVSSNGITKVLTVQKDQTIGNWETTTEGAVSEVDVPELKIAAIDGLNEGEEFYLELENAKWATEQELKSAIETAVEAFEVTRVNDTELKITLKSALKAADKNDFVNIPLLATATGGQAAVSIIAENTTLTSEKVIFAVTPETDIQGYVEVGTPASFYKGGEIAPITLTEVAPGSFANAKDKFVKITLNHTDFDFQHKTDQPTTITVGKEEVSVYEITTVKQTGSRGLEGISATAKAYVDKDDAQVMYVELPSKEDAKSKGKVEFTGIQVTSAVKNPEVGDLKVDIEGKSIENKLGATVAKVAEYGVELEVKDDKAVEIQAGHEGKVTFTLSENVEDSIANGTARTVEFVLDNGHFAHATKGEDGKPVAPKAMELGKITNGKTTLDLEDVIVDYIYDDEDNIVGFEANLPATNKIDTFTFEDVVVHAPLTAEGAINLTVEGRAIDEAKTKEIATIKATAQIKSEAMTVKVGLKDQKGGKITVTEAQEGQFAKGKALEFVIDSEGDFEFTGAPEVKVTEGDLQLGEAVLDKATGTLTVPIKRASKTASTIEIKDFQVKVDRTVPEGKYDMTVGGSALTSCGSLVVEDFFVVGTPNTEDNVGNNGLLRGTASFKVGEKSFLHNGEEVEMDAAPYITSKDRVMVPVRYVSEAFGVAKQNILFNKGTVTIIAGNRVLQLQNGSNIALLNGVKIPMDEQVTIKGDRTYIPMGEIARLLGIDSVEWNNQEKIATFTNR